MKKPGFRLGAGTHHGEEKGTTPLSSPQKEDRFGGTGKFVPVTAKKKHYPLLSPQKEDRFGGNRKICSRHGEEKGTTPLSSPQKEDRFWGNRKFVPGSATMDTYNKVR
ncbi:hypothetical protein KKC97_12915 [bacterium]|nr:hypothetical protein [bacterium]MBU1920094.1 hypothetical protein [bacterium]